MKVHNFKKIKYVLYYEVHMYRTFHIIWCIVPCLVCTIGAGTSTTAVLSTVQVL
jgi:Mn2+/Fe2+ NRAMP family transporter